MRESVQRSVENIFPSFRLFLSSAPLPRPPSPQWKPLELRKIDKSPAAEQFVYSAAWLRANELERITYSYGLASSSFLLKSRSSMILLPTLYASPEPPLHVDEDGAASVTLHACVHVYYILSTRGALFCHGS